MTVIKEKFNSYAMSIEANTTNICCLQYDQVQIFCMEN
uniref:Uncharacterized protein n=1 Tax=Arundo donax TaxID=35708 RepID=A0A0A9DPW7_ARUDO